MSSSKLPQFTEDQLREELDTFFRKEGKKPPELKLTDTTEVFGERDQANGRYWFRKINPKLWYYPFADSKGVYLFFGEDNHGVYVGQASQGNSDMGSRIGDHVSHTWVADADYVVSIPIADEKLARDFECYLRKKFDFPGNKQ